MNIHHRTAANHSQRPQSPRIQKVRRAVRDGLDRWYEQRPLSSDDPFSAPDWQNSSPDPNQDVLGAMPRREPLTVQAVSRISPRTMRLASPFKDSRLLAFRRFFIWLFSITYFLGGVLADKLRRKDSEHRRAVRLRRTFTRIGGTFIKFGQQMSIRVDLLPLIYCEELTKLLDRVAPFPSEEAIRIIERCTGRPLSETFAVFDPEPIGSASVACVYQAVLKNGDKVAVKVRRPGIGEQFVADFRVLHWLFSLLETLTILRPGFTENVLKEVQATLMEELDFYKEARFQEIFRRRAQKARRPFFTAPRVYPHISGEDVLVEEYVSGIWLWELLSAVEYNDRDALAKIRRLNIDPKIVARRLLWVSNWGLWESVIFHADPHPANIIIQRNNRLVFIDFGSMGTLTESRRQSLHEIFRLEEKEDLEGISRAALTLLEPLPPIDVENVLKAIEDVFWEGLIATRSKQSEWWERTSAQLWLGFFRVTSRFQIPMTFDTVRMIRATLLYDTLAARLDHDIDVGRHYRRFMKDAGREARRRLSKGVQTRLERGFTERDYVRMERMLKMGDQMFFQAQRLLNLRQFNYAALVGKFVSSILLTLSGFLQAVIFTVIVILLVTIWQTVVGGTIPPLQETFRQVVTGPIYQLSLLFLSVIGIRRILFRLRDKEVTR
ncbi:MAG: AarF/ABC1/UbiB kinase family protein [Candidatus Promineifilaceae bacterium]